MDTLLDLPMAYHWRVRMILFVRLVALCVGLGTLRLRLCNAGYSCCQARIRGLAWGILG